MWQDLNGFEESAALAEASGILRFAAHLRCVWRAMENATPSDFVKFAKFLRIPLISANAAISKSIPLR